MFIDWKVSPEPCKRFIERRKRTTKIESYIYFITDGEFVKIGSAERPEQRLRDLQIANARELKILFTIPIYKIRGGHYQRACIEVETYLQKGFGANHIRGEWYDILNRIDPEEWRKAFEAKEVINV